MKLNTTRFGEIELQPGDFFTFPHGLPGFEEENQFIILQPDTSIPFSYLQSTRTKELAFIITTPFIFYPDYQFELPDTVQQELQIETEKEALVWSIVTIEDNIREATINLLAPLITNPKSRLGKQFVLHGAGYRTKHPLIAAQEAE